MFTSMSWSACPSNTLLLISQYSLFLTGQLVFEDYSFVSFLFTSLFIMMIYLSFLELLNCSQKGFFDWTPRGSLSSITQMTRWSADEKDVEKKEGTNKQFAHAFFFVNGSKNDKCYSLSVKEHDGNGFLIPMTIFLLTGWSQRWYCLKRWLLWPRSPGREPGQEGKGNCRDLLVMKSAMDAWK